MMENRNRNLTCLVTLPDSVQLGVDVDRNSDGRDILSKICDSLHILEVDYFGLMYYGSNGEKLWLNLRNRLTTELTGSPPYRLHLRVKFFVEPHLIQQDATRNQFFLNAKEQFLSGNLRSMSTTEVIDLAALLYHINQEELNQSVISSGVTDWKQFLPPEYDSDTYKNLVLSQCEKLGKLSIEMAKNNFLQSASTSDFFGVHFHDAKDEFGKEIHVGVGQDGIMEYGEDWKLSRSCAWSALQCATHNAFNVILNTVQDDGITKTHSLKLTNKAAANALYRDMTEMHSFYHCDTIGSLVTEQYCRDLKGTIASFFNENTCLGKRYVFDIQRTLREAYDYARRILYSAEMRSGQNSTSSVINNSAFLVPESSHSCSSSCQAVQQLNKIHESLSCHICFDADINIAFVPCGHVICCTACAQQLDCCPVCKSTINQAQPVFLPYTKPMFGTASGTFAVACT